MGRDSAQGQHLRGTYYASRACCNDAAPRFPEVLDYLTHYYLNRAVFVECITNGLSDYYCIYCLYGSRKFNFVFSESSEKRGCNRDSICAAYYLCAVWNYSGYTIGSRANSLTHTMIDRADCTVSADYTTRMIIGCDSNSTTSRDTEASDYGLSCPTRSWPSSSKKSYWKS